jgi:hypothetical protein
MNREIQILYKMENYLFKKISVEHMIRKMNDIDKLKFVFFKEEEIVLFDLLDNYKVQNTNTYIQNLWIKYEFEKYSRHIEKGDWNVIFDNLNDEKKETYSVLFSKFNNFAD